jgi:hypothetical protein
VVRSICFGVGVTGLESLRYESWDTVSTEGVKQVNASA